MEQLYFKQIYGVKANRTFFLHYNAPTLHFLNNTLSEQ